MSNIKSSIRHNFLYSSFLTTANYIFPLITYPYISRILGVTNIGLVNLIDGIINYFVLFSTMGIGIVGIREIASVKNNQKKLNETFSSLITLSLIFTTFALIILIVASHIVPELRQNYRLVYVGTVKLLFNFFLIEWLYKGLEDFKYITIRGIIIRCLYVVSIFVFVKSQNDYGVYYFLTTLMIVLNAVINVIYSRNIVSFTFANLKCRYYLKPLLSMGFYNILTSMYTTFNIVYLGFICNDTEVGYYTTATKLFSIILALFTAFTGVMLPRMSSLIYTGKIKEFTNKINKSISIIVNISVPTILFTEILTNQIIDLISGPGYEAATIPMRIVMPLILIIGYEQILVIQMLMPLKKDKIILRNSILGATAGVLLNIFIVPSLAAVGSAIVWVCCEIIILISSQVSLKAYISFSPILFKLFKEILLYIPLACIILLFELIIDENFKSISISIATCLSYFIFISLKRSGNEIGLLIKQIWSTFSKP